MALVRRESITSKAVVFVFRRHGIRAWCRVHSGAVGFIADFSGVVVLLSPAVVSLA